MMDYEGNEDTEEGIGITVVSAIIKYEQKDCLRTLKGIKIVNLLDIVHRPNLIKNTTFRRRGSLNLVFSFPSNFFLLFYGLWPECKHRH
jgi:hypothetical protein